MTEYDVVNSIKAREMFLDDCRKLRDWHGVRDAAADLEKFEALLKLIREREAPL